MLQFHLLKNSSRYFIHLFLVYLLSGWSTTAFAQDDLLKMLQQGDSSTYKRPVGAAFKTIKIINLQTAELLGKQLMDVRITHRFGAIGTSTNGKSSYHNIWGFDESSDIRIGFDFGITDNLNVGFARSKNHENWELSGKYRFLRQRRNNSIPFTAALFANMTFSTKDDPRLIFDNPSSSEEFSRRFAYSSQLVLQRKFSKRISLELVPGMVYHNFVESYEDNLALSCGLGGKIRITNSMSVIGDYVFNLGDVRGIGNKYGFYNPLGLGVEFETGGHVFSLMFTNASVITETEYITDTVDTWSKGGMRFSFTISRAFHLKKDKEMLKESQE
jgi:hypothetical protein